LFYSDLAKVSTFNLRRQLEKKPRRFKGGRIPTARAAGLRSLATAAPGNPV